MTPTLRSSERIPSFESLEPRELLTSGFESVDPAVRQLLLDIDLLARDQDTSSRTRAFDQFITTATSLPVRPEATLLSALRTQKASIDALLTEDRGFLRAHPLPVSPTLASASMRLSPSSRPGDLGVIPATGDYMRSASFSPDQSSLLLADGKYLRRYDPLTNREIWTVEPHRGQIIIESAFSPDGQAIVTQGYDKSVTLLEAQTGSVLWKAPMGTWIDHIEFSPDGQRILVTDYDNRIQALDRRTGRPTMIVPGGNPDVWSASFAPDASMVYADQSTLRFLDAAGTPQGSLQLPFSPYRSTFSPDGSLLLSTPYPYGPNQGRFALISMATKTVLATTVVPEQNVARATFSPNGKVLAVVTNGSRLYLYRVDGQTLVPLQTIDASNVATVRFSPDGSAMVLGLPTEARVLRSPAAAVDPPRPPSEILAAQRRIDQNTMVGSTYANAVDLVVKDMEEDARRDAIFERSMSLLLPNPTATSLPFAAELYKLPSSAHASGIGTIRGSGDMVRSVSISPDQSSLLLADGKYLRRYDPLTNREIWTVEPHRGQIIIESAFSPDGQAIVTQGYDKSVTLLEAQTGSVLWKAPMGTWIDHIEFSPDGQRILVTDYDNRIQALDRRTGRPTMIVPGGNPDVWSASMSPAGTIAHADGAHVRLRSPEGNLLSSLQLGFRPYRSTFSPDGSLLAVTKYYQSRDPGHFAIVDTATQRTIFEGDTKGTNAARIVFSPNGKVFAVVTNSSVLHLYGIEGQTVTPLPSLDRLPDATIPSFTADGSLLVVGHGKSVTAFRTPAEAKQSVVSPATHDLIRLTDREVDAPTLPRLQFVTHHLMAQIGEGEHWSTAGKPDRLGLLRSRGRELSAIASHGERALTALATFESLPATSSDERTQVLSLRTSLAFSLTVLQRQIEEWTTEQQAFDALDWQSLTKASMAKLFPSEHTERTAPMTILSLQGPSVTLAIRDPKEGDTVMIEGEGPLSRSGLVVAKGSLLGSATVSVDPKQPTGDYLLRLLARDGSQRGIQTLHWDQGTRTLTAPTSAQLFMPEASGSDDGTLALPDLLLRAETEQAEELRLAGRMSDNAEALQQFTALTFYPSAAGTAIVTIAYKSRQLELLQTISVLRHPQVFSALPRFEELFRTLPQWQEKNREETKRALRLDDRGFDLYRSQDYAFLRRHVAGYDDNLAPMLDLGMSIVLRLRRGEDVGTDLVKLREIDRWDSGYSSRVGLQYPSSKTILDVCVLALATMPEVLIPLHDRNAEWADREDWKFHNPTPTYAGTGAATAPTTGITAADAMQLVRIASRNEVAAKARGVSGSSLIPYQTASKQAAATYVAAVQAEVQATKTAESPPPSQSTTTKAPKNPATKKAEQTPGLTAERASVDAASAIVSRALVAAGSQNTEIYPGLSIADPIKSYDLGEIAPTTATNLRKEVTVGYGGTAAIRFTLREPMMVNGWVDMKTSMVLGAPPYFPNIDLGLAGDALKGNVYRSANKYFSGESISSVLPNGTYLMTISVEKLSGSLVNAVPVPLSLQFAPYDARKVEGRISTQAKDVTMPVRMEKVEFLNGKGIDDLHDVSSINSKKPVWLVIHGRKDSPDSSNMKELSRRFFESGYQVIAVDWSEAARHFSQPLTYDAVDLSDADWTPAVGSWVGQQLLAMGFEPEDVNIVGHSHGTYAGYYAARWMKDHSTLRASIGSFVALDSAKNSYVLGSHIRESEIRFADVASTSLSVWSSFLGSSERAISADRTIELRSASWNPIDEHGYAVSVFSNLLDDMRKGRNTQMTQFFEKGEHGELSANLFPHVRGTDAIMDVLGYEVMEDGKKQVKARAASLRLTAIDSQKDLYVDDQAAAIISGMQ